MEISQVKQHHIAKWLERDWPEHPPKKAQEPEQETEEAAADETKGNPVKSDCQTR